MTAFSITYPFHKMFYENIPCDSYPISEETV